MTGTSVPKINLTQSEQWRFAGMDSIRERERAEHCLHLGAPAADLASADPMIADDMASVASGVSIASAVSARLRTDASRASVASAARSKAFSSTSIDSRPGTAPNKLWLNPLDTKDHWSDRLTRVPTKASLLRHEMFVEEAKQKFAQNFFTKNAAV